MAIYNKTGDLPKSIRREEKRNTVFTDQGIDRIQTFTDAQGKKKRKVERINKMRGLVGAAGNAKPSFIEFDKKTAVVNTPVNVLLSYTQPVKATGSFTLAIANTAGGSAKTATANNTLSYADNTLTFAFTPTVPGTYTVRGQTIGGTNTLLSVYANTAATKVFANNNVDSVLTVTAS